uniref:Aa_trans domain-containing protein n=1 Tax=Steinernema glaseri TaxID=37863 RepID=A0A1I8A777_9BILA
MGSLMHTVFAVLFSIIGYFFYKYSDSLKEEQFPETDMFSRQFTIHGFTLNMNTHRRAISLGAVLMNYVICLLILIFARPYGPITKLAAAFPFYYGTVYNGVLYVASRLPVKKRSLVAAAAFYNFILAVCLVITGIIFFITAFDYYYFRELRIFVFAQKSAKSGRITWDTSLLNSYVRYHGTSRRAIGRESGSSCYLLALRSRPLLRLLLLLPLLLGPPP